jgi:uncharacterized protein YwqG
MPSPIEQILSQPELADVADSLRALARWSIRIECDEPAPQDLPIGCSKFGGLPDLPAGVDWPMFTAPLEGQSHPVQTPIPLAAQIRLSDVAPFDREHALPVSGWLWFFTDIFGLYKLHGLEAVYEGPPSSHVLFAPNESILLERRQRPAGMYPERPWLARPIDFRMQQTIPNLETAWIADPGKTNGLIKMDSQAWDVYGELRRELIESGRRHRLLGYSDDVQPCVLENGYARARHYLFPELPPVDRTSEAFYEECRQGSLLLQIETNDDMHFGRWGCGAFFIRDDDLRDRRFDRVWFHEA